MLKKVAVLIIFWTSDTEMPRIREAEIKKDGQDKHVRKRYLGR